MNSNDFVINTENLSRSFGEVHALKSLDLRVPPKPIFAFLNQGELITQTSIEELLVGKGDLVYSVTLKGNTERAYTQVTQQPWVSKIEVGSPILLTFSLAPDQINALSLSFMTGELVSSWLPLISTVVSCVVFIAVAIRRFNRQEF